MVLLKIFPHQEIPNYLKENPLDITRFEKNEWEKAVVIKVFGNGAQVNIGEHQGFISVDTMGWAREPDIDLFGSQQTNTIKDARAVLKPGDLVWVSLKLATAKELAKLKKTNPKKAATQLISLEELVAEIEADLAAKHEAEREAELADRRKAEHAAKLAGEFATKVADDFATKITGKPVAKVVEKPEVKPTVKPTAKKIIPLALEQYPSVPRCTYFHGSTNR